MNFCWCLCIPGNNNCNSPEFPHGPGPGMFIQYCVSGGRGWRRWAGWRGRQEGGWLWAPTGGRRGGVLPTASSSCSLSGRVLAMEVPSLWTWNWTSPKDLEKTELSGKCWWLLSLCVSIFRFLGHWLGWPWRAVSPGAAMVTLDHLVWTVSEGSGCKISPSTVTWQSPPL